MAGTIPFNTFISGLPAASSVNAADLIYIEQGGVSKKATANIMAGAAFAPITVNVRSSSSGTVTVSALTDYFLALDPTSNTITVNLPVAPATGLTFLIKDVTGKAATNNITVTPAAGTIDGSATFVMSINFQSVAVTYTGTQWSIN